MGIVNWEVETPDGVVTLSLSDLHDILAKKFTETDSPDRQELTMFIMKFLQENEALGRMPLIDIVYLSFNIGYYYNSFLSKNKVEIKLDPIEKDND